MNHSPSLERPHDLCVERVVPEVVDTCMVSSPVKVETSKEHGAIMKEHIQNVGSNARWGFVDALQ